MRLKSFLIIGIILLVGTMVIAFGGCNSAFYTGKAFTYPPGSEPHNNDWDYFGEVIIASTAEGSYYNKSEKVVRITVVDKKKKRVLFDEMKFSDCGGIGVKPTWNKFDELYIDLYEKIDKGDILNEKGVSVLDIEEIPLCKLSFKYDDKDKRFKLVERTDLR